ncbi:MAG TPA: ABC transporter permease [Candidatus Sulfotelmatobacter sp.]|nr:ABC transporter permease [Candidatus Sulfotelmatobacter sp.]
MRRTLPVLVVVLALLAVWYAAALIVGLPTARALAPPHTAPLGLVGAALTLDRPLVPAPQQVAATLVAGIAQPITSPRSLIYHAGVTASTAVVGFLLAFAVGIALAIGIVNLRVLDRSIMPWIIASQTVPALAVAPMVVVVLGNMGLTGLIPKALIAAWLSFFPIVTSMVAGLRSPDRIQLDLLRTYSAGGWDVFRRLRWPASMGFLFPGMKVAATLAVVGAIVAELPTGAQAGLGARLLGASYYGQTLQLWATLVMASLLAVVAVAMTDAARAILVRARGGRL